MPIATTAAKIPPKNAEVYEVLTLFAGFSGLNRLYLGQPGIATARLMCVASALALTVTGIMVLSAPCFAAAAAFGLLLVGLWVSDYVRLHEQVARAG